MPSAKRTPSKGKPQRSVINVARVPELARHGFPVHRGQPPDKRIRA
jgi:hypothetical protein